jgi:tetratricopeptide (TPR) repeat protein
MIGRPQRTMRIRNRMNDIQTEFERLRRTGDDHYGRKEYSIAAECYRAATERGLCDHSVWFKFAFSLAELGKHSEAAKAYEMAIVAGSGAAAHNNLGLCYRRLGKNQEARDEFVKATRLERSDAFYWRNLAVCLADLKEPKAELNALESLLECSGCTAGDWNKLGCAREREGDVEGGLVAFRNAASAAPDECAYFFNIALMHERSGRVLDAYHACRHSLNLNDGYGAAAKMIPRLEKALERPPAPPPLPSKAEYKFNCPLCGQHISASESFAETRVSCPTCAGAFIAPRAPETPRQIGPHDYVNPYALLNLSAVSELPDALEWFDQPENWDDLIGSLTRRRRALKAELELNEGILSWLPQLHITDEVVHRVFSDLDDSGWHPHHWAVFRLPLLSRFLMHGNLDYFYSLEDAPYPLVAEIAGAAPDDFEQEEFIAFISAFFRHRWVSAIKQALDAGNYAEVSALFATSAPVTAADLDEALEPVRRHFARRRETLKQLEDSVESGSKTNPDAQLQLAAGEAKLLNVLPTHLGAKLRDDMCFAYRSISIALANHKSDYAASERALKAAESFQASVTTKQRLTEDRTTISGLLRREQEEKRREQQLTLRLSLKSWFRERTLEITPERFTWGEESIAAEQMDGVRYGITIKYTNGIKTGADSILALRSANGAVVATDWLGEGNFSDAVRSVMGLYAHSIMTKILLALEGRGCRIGQLQLTKHGIAFETGIIFTKQHVVPWTDAETDVASGNVQIYSRSERKSRTSLACRDHWNACLLPTLVEIMKSSAK